MSGWYLTPAVQLCTLIEQIVPKYNFHTALTGGVLYKTNPRKDLDILLYRVHPDSQSYQKRTYYEVAYLPPADDSAVGEEASEQASELEELFRDLARIGLIRQDSTIKDPPSWCYKMLWIYGTDTPWAVDLFIGEDTGHYREREKPSPTNQSLG